MTTNVVDFGTVSIFDCHKFVQSRTSSPYTGKPRSAELAADIVRTEYRTYSTQHHRASQTAELIAAAEILKKQNGTSELARIFE